MQLTVNTFARLQRDIDGQEPHGNLDLGLARSVRISQYEVCAIRSLLSVNLDLYPPSSSGLRLLSACISSWWVSISIADTYQAILQQIPRIARKFSNTLAPCILAITRIDAQIQPAKLHLAHKAFSNFVPFLTRTARFGRNESRMDGIVDK